MTITPSASTATKTAATTSVAQRLGGCKPGGGSFACASTSPAAIIGVSHLCTVRSRGDCYAGPVQPRVIYYSACLGRGVKFWQARAAPPEPAVHKGRTMRRLCFENPFGTAWNGRSRASSAKLQLEDGT